MIIEDFVMLGRTVPEESKRHGLVVCSAGYSRELRQFIRIYPISRFCSIPRWSLCTVQVRRNPHDSRIESWRIADNQEPVITGNVKKCDEFDFLKSLASNSIWELNNRRASLGIVAPGPIGYRFDGMKQNEEYLTSLFPTDVQEKRRPRLMFSDDVGNHDLQLRDWGSHEFIRKQPENSHYRLWDALKLNDTCYEHLLFVGNHNQHRNSWLVIGMVSEKNRLQTALDLS